MTEKSDNISTKKPVLDACCGARKMYFDKDAECVVFGDIRDASFVQVDGRRLEVKPDIRLDFTELPFPDESFSLVVFDPPHLRKVGQNSFMGQSYGSLPYRNSLTPIALGFDECWRVLKPNGTLIFKWSATDFSLQEVLKAIRRKPLFGNRRPSRETFWMVFFKTADENAGTDMPALF